MNIKTIADLKRYIKVGVPLTMTYHAYAVNGMYNNNTALPMTRNIKHTQTNSFQFEPITGQEQGGWLEFPKAKEIQFLDDGFNILNDSGEIHISYKY